VVFEGVIRPTEGGRAIRAISYDAYRPMADRQLHDLGTEALERFGLMRMMIEHSIGRVEAGRVSFRLTVCAAHRAPALAGMAWFIDRMKEDVPIWKRIEPATDEGER
jgi:molybdopterin synthase catalytic subunit